VLWDIKGNSGGMSEQDVVAVYICIAITYIVKSIVVRVYLE
jgi:hypothetical protein